MNDKENWKPGNGQKIEKLYAWIATEPDGGEGVLGWDLLGKGMQPLIGADRQRIESYRPFAAAASKMTGCPVVLKVFGHGTVIDRLERADD